MNLDPRYPHIRVRLTGQNGNAFNLIGIVKRAMRQHDVPRGEIEEFSRDATSGDYTHLIRTCVAWVDVS